MPSIHLSIKIVSRGQGKSAVAAAIYRAGEKITNQYDGIEHDYTRKGGVAYSQILLPDNAPAEYKDRAVLWNAVEKSEAAKNAQLAREIEIALPKELTLLQNKSLVRRYVQENFVDKGMCADIAIHDKKDGNPHAHILLTMRPIEQSGKRIVLKSGVFKARKIYTTDWNEPTKAEEWRAAWADTANLFLEKLKHEARIDHRSFERQGIEQIPTTHMGMAATQMERRGILSRFGKKSENVVFEMRFSRPLIRSLTD